MSPEARLANLRVMADALVRLSYTHDHGFYHSATCKLCRAVGHTKQAHGGPPVERGDVHHRDDCPVGIAHDVLAADASPSGGLKP